SGQTADTNAISEPSGDHRALFASVEMVVSCLASPPCRSMTQSWKSPDRFDSKRIFEPSGLQRGWRSFFSVLVSWRGAPPSDGASQMVEAVLLASRSTVPTT